jgi:hypothetical protein
MILPKTMDPTVDYLGELDRYAVDDLLDAALHPAIVSTPSLEQFRDAFLTMTEGRARTPPRRVPRYPRGRTAPTGRGARGRRGYHRGQAPTNEAIDAGRWTLRRESTRCGKAGASFVRGHARVDVEQTDTVIKKYLGKKKPTMAQLAAIDKLVLGKDAAGELEPKALPKTG